MGVDRRHIRIAVIAAFFLAGVVLVGATPSVPAATGSPSAATSRCDRHESTTLIETRRVRVYALPEEPMGHQLHRKPTIASRPVFGCLEETGRPLLLDLPEVANEHKALWVEVDSPTVAANGPLVAYSYTEYYLDTHATWVRVSNLRTRAVVRTCFVGGGMAPHRLPRVTDIVLDSSGDVGWKSEGGQATDSEDRPAGCNLAA